MSNTVNVNAVISELEQINDWLCEIEDIDNEINELPSKKESEISDTNSKYLGAFDIKDYIEKLPSLMSLIDLPLTDFVPLFPPKNWRDTNAEEDIECEELIEKWLSNEGKEKLYDVFREYDKIFLSVAEECDTEYKRLEDTNVSKLDEIEKKYEKISNELTDRKEHLQNQLNGITLIPEELFGYADEIARMLKLKRADTLKEAINLVFDEIRKDNEELERRLEAYEQKRLLEEQAEDNRIHNKAMERAAEQEARAMREHNAVMERAARAQADAERARADAAQAQAREAQKQNQMAQKQASDALRNAQLRCSKCIKRGSCSVYGDAAIGCPSFTPRS